MKVRQMCVQTKARQMQNKQKSVFSLATQAKNATNLLTMAVRFVNQSVWKLFTVKLRKP